MCRNFSKGSRRGDEMWEGEVGDLLERSKETLSIEESRCLEWDRWHGESALFLLLIELFWGGFNGDGKSNLCLLLQDLLLVLYRL